MWTVNSPEVERNYGFWNEEVQQAILDTHVAIAGVGGDGFQLGVKLARMGVQTFDIADPEVFEPQNVNRVPGASTETYGKNKAEVFKEEVLNINPDADVRIYTDGINEENIKEFMERANMVFDESELTMLHLGTMVAREARRRGIPDILVMNVGFAAQVTSFHPDSNWTFEKLMGIPKDAPLSEIRDMKVDLSRCVPYIPKYIDLDSLVAASNGAPLPSIAAGVDVAASMGESQALKHITDGIKGYEKPIWAPRIAYQDSYGITQGITRFPRLSHIRSAGYMALRNKLGLNPKASYTDVDRARRQVAYAAEQAAQTQQ